MTNPDRLTALDASFLHIENQGDAHMHVAAVMTFDGEAPPYDDVVDMLVARLDLVPRYRQRLAHVPLGQGRPRWVDDPHFNPRYHIRHTALPRPGDDDQLKRLAGRVFAQELDRSKPLWEIWIVEGLDAGTGGEADGRRFAVLSKTHHALVDGVSGVDVTTVLFDTSPDPAPAPVPAHAWTPRPVPSDAQLLGEAMLERATVPGEIVRGIRALFRAPRRVADSARDSLVGLGAMAWAGLHPAPSTPYNVRIGPHRRYEWVDADLGRFKAIKDALGGTVNDVVLTVVNGAVGRHLREHGHDTDGLVLKAMVPVSVRADAERGALGNKVAAMWAPLPVGIADPVEAFHEVHAAMADLKGSGQAVGAQVLTELTGFAPPTIMNQAARLQSRQRFFNLVVTNIPGPQFPLYMMGRRLCGLYPVVPLAANQALGIAIMSYDGRLGFGLMADRDGLADLDVLAGFLRDSIDELAAVAGIDGGGGGNGAPRRRRTTKPAASART